MKKCISGILISGLVLLLMAACNTVPGGITQEDRAAIDAVVNNWIEALQSEDLETWIDTYWPDIVHTTRKPDGTVIETVRGIENLKTQQREWFEGGDIFKLIVYSDPQRDFKSEPGEPIYTINGKVGEGEWGWQDIFKLSKRNGEWRIIDHILSAPAAD